jgi:hypothetical protein
MNSDTEQIHMISNNNNNNNNNKELTKITQTPNTYLKWSILNLICSIFCIFGLIFSMASFVYSFKTQDDIENGNLKKAKRNSKLAKKFNIIVSALCIASFFLIILIICIRSTSSRLSSVNNNSKKNYYLNTINNNNDKKKENFTNLIIGNWKLVSSDNFIQYLSELKVNFLIQSLADAFYPNVEFQFNSETNEWKIIGTTAIKTVTSVFKLDIEFDEELFDQNCKSLYKLDNNNNRFYKTQTYSDGRFSWVYWELGKTNDILLNIFHINKTKAVRTFKRVDFNDYD